MYKDWSAVSEGNQDIAPSKMDYAASTLATLAQTAIHTADDGLESGRLTIKVGDIDLPIYRSAPKGKSDLPVIIVIQEIFGVHEYIADVTRRLAKEGYLAIAPDLYTRQGDPTQYTDIHVLLEKIVSKVPDEQVKNDIDATVNWAAQHGGNINRLGVTGFCWGGRQTWLYAASNPKVKAAVAWYGKVVGPKNDLQPKHPVDIAASLHAPVLGLYGKLDSSIPLTSIQEMQTALKQAADQGNQSAKESTFVIYHEAGHAFHADYRPSYHEVSAKDGWQQLLGWFKKYI